jgi:cytochrome b
MVICIAGDWLTSLSDRWLSIHVFLGYLMLGLIAWRLLWGWVGGRYARFKSFVVSPCAAIVYLVRLWKQRDPHYAGHNPAAAQAILLILLVGLLLGLSGLALLGSEEQQGLLTGWLGISAGHWLKEVHEFLAIAMLVVVAVHLLGVIVGSFLHRDNLPLTMFTGMKLAPEYAVPSKPYNGLGIALLLCVAAYAASWFFYAWHESVEARLGQIELFQEAVPVPVVGAALPDDPTWREECGACHMAYHPSLLPTRSWIRIMAEQHRHFGNDLALDPPTLSTVLEFMVRNAAENSNTEAAFKINTSLMLNVTPLRITETPYWVEKHNEISQFDMALPLVKSKSNCAACHLDAEAGTFQDSAIRIPRKGLFQ